MKFCYYVFPNIYRNLVCVYWYYSFQNIFTQINRKLNLIPLYTAPLYFGNINILHNIILPWIATSQKQK